MNIFLKSVKPILFLISILIFVFSCNKKDDIVDPPPGKTGPEFTTINISGDNKQVSVGFTEGVYKGGFLNQPISAGELTVSLQGGQALLDSFNIVHVAGDTLVHIRLFTSGFPTGEEQIKISPANATAVVNSAAIPMKVTEQLTINLSDIGIIGNWVSTGENLSPVYQQFGFDSIYMQYRVDGSYTFESFTPGGIHNTLSGTYSQSISSVAGIRQITLNQLLPVSAVISGIFSLQASATIFMNYETVQTEPAVAGLTPPTPEGGFGSSGLLGSDNTQVFLRVEAD